MSLRNEFFTIGAVRHYSYELRGKRWIDYTKQLDSYAYSYGHETTDKNLDVAIGTTEKFTEIGTDTVNTAQVDKPGKTHIQNIIIDKEDETISVPMDLYVDGGLKGKEKLPAMVEVNVEAHTSLYFKTMSFNLELGSLLDSAAVYVTRTLVGNDHMRKIVIFIYGLIKPPPGALPSLRVTANFTIHGDRDRGSFLGLSASVDIRLSQSFFTLNIPRPAHIKRNKKRDLPAVVARLAPPSYPWEALKEVAESQ